MRLKNIIRSTVAAGISFGLSLGLVACSRDYTVAWVYTISGGSSNGFISAYGVDYETGILNQVAGSPFSFPFTNPSMVVAAPNNKFIYVIGGSENAQVEEFSVGTDGKLYGEHTYNLTGTEAPNTGQVPLKVGAAIDSTGTFLYVTFTYQNGYSPASPGPGGVTIFQISQTDGSLSNPQTLNVGNNPVGVAVSTPVCVTTPVISSNPSCTGVAGGGSGVYNVYVYVLDQEASPNATILGFAQNMSTGALTPLSGTTNSTTVHTGYPAGVTPSAIAIDGTARYVYVTDEQQNEVLGYSIARSTTGNLTPLSGSPFGTGLFPVAITVDPRSYYVYTANYNSNTVSQFTISQATGNLSTIAGGTFTAATGPTCVTVEPALGIFLYTSDYESSTISGGELSANTGAVNAVTNSFFTTSANPSCITSVANGAHAVSVLTP